MSSRKSSRIAAKPAKKVEEEEEGSEEEGSEEEVVAVKGKKRAAAKVAKADPKTDSVDGEENAEPKKQKTAAPSAETAAILAKLAEAAKGSRKVREILTINPSATTTTVTTTTTTTEPDGTSSVSVVTVKELESAGFEKHFDEIADALLNHSVLFISGLPHRVLELEFYCNGHQHVDDFAHGNERQKTRAQWYFHMQGKGYKGGTYKGLDVTFGDEGFYGGILLRSLQPLFGDFHPVEGPSLLVDYVLKTTDAAKIEELVGRFDLSAEVDLEKEDPAHIKHPLFFVHSDKEIDVVPPHKIYKGARVGLSMKAFTQGKQNYVGKFYRYMVTPDKIKKGRNYLVVSLYQQGHTPEQIVEATKSTKSSVEKLIGLFNGGKAKDFKKFCGVNLSDGEVCEMIGSCATFCYPAK